MTICCLVTSCRTASAAERKAQVIEQVLPFWREFARL